ncbi:MAG: class I SAM-dependent methyltransferase [Gemmatimonadales bacterium]
MDPRLQLRVQRYGWDKAEPLYERFWAAQLEPAQRRLLALANLRPGDRILDVAAGTGLVTFPAAEAVGPGGQVTATDLSEAMVESLRTGAVARGLANVTALRMDGESLDFPSASFDAALCALGLMYFPDPRRSLAGIRRVLQPGGRAVAAVWGARRHCGWAEIFPIVEARVASEVCPLFFQLGTGDALAAGFEAAGFRDLTVERLTTVLRYDSAEDACGAAFAGGPVALAYSRFDETTRAAAHRDYLDSIAEYRRGTGYDIPGEFVIVAGRAPAGQEG